jgi:hypothetical protein
MCKAETDRTENRQSYKMYISIIAGIKECKSVQKLYISLTTYFKCLMSIQIPINKSTHKNRLQLWHMLWYDRSIKCKVILKYIQNRSTVWKLRNTNLNTPKISEEGRCKLEKDCIFNGMKKKSVNLYFQTTN